MNIIPMNPPKQQEPRCSFCDAPKSKARIMVGNPNGSRYICDKCIAQAAKRLQEAA